MIFVTVGTHEQPFDRLLKKVDELVENKALNKKVFAQIGHSSYIPKRFKYKRLLTSKEMNNFAKEAGIVITHGGPASIILALSYGKIPIVVPRQKKYGEHVDNHQVLFSKRLEERKRVIAVYEIEDLADKVINYDSIIQSMRIPHNYQEVHKERVENFAKKLDRICQELCKSVI